MRLPKQPKDLFSRQWYDKESFGMTMLSGDLFYRVDSLLNKLNELRSIHSIRRPNEERSNDDVLIHETIENLKSFTGVWYLTYDHTFKEGILGWKSVMSYPNNGTRMGLGNIEKVLGKNVKLGYYLVMASPEAVQWLNAVSKLVGVHV